MRTRRKKGTSLFLLTYGVQNILIVKRFDSFELYRSATSDGYHVLPYQCVS